VLETILKFIPLFLLSCFKFAFGVPAAFWTFDFNFWESLLFSSIAGFTGILISVYLSRILIYAWIIVKEKLFGIKKIATNEITPKKRFSKKSRFMVKLIRKYGLAGIALLTPPLISIPVGSLLATKIYGKHPKVLIYLFGSVIFWSFSFSFVLSLF